MSIPETGRWSLEITLPWPPSGLSPNSVRGKNWAVVWAAARRYKAATEAAVMDWLAAGGTRPPAGFIRAEAVFCPPNRIRRDLDGCLGAMKHALDSVAATLGVDDSVFRPWAVDFGAVVAGRGEVVLRLVAHDPAWAALD